MEDLSEPVSPQLTDEFLCRRIAHLTRQKELPLETKARIVASIRKQENLRQPASPSATPPNQK